MADDTRFRFSPIYEDSLHSEPYRLGWVDKDGVVHVEEVSYDEWLRAISGRGSTPKPDSLAGALEQLEKVISAVNPLLPDNPIRDRISEICSDNYSDELGYPTEYAFDDIADAILEEFQVFPKCGS